MATSRNIPVSKLKVGDTFSEIPEAWHGRSVVTQIYKSGPGYFREVYCVKFDNKKVINPPGVLYVEGDTKVRKWLKVRK